MLSCHRDRYEDSGSLEFDVGTMIYFIPT